MNHSNLTLSEREIQLKLKTNTPQEGAEATVLFFCVQSFELDIEFHTIP